MWEASFVSVLEETEMKPKAFTVTLKETRRKKILQSLYYKTGSFKYIAMYLNDRYA